MPILSEPFQKSMVSTIDCRQITLPADVVWAVGLQTNDALDVSVVNVVIHLVPVAAAARHAPSRALREACAARQIECIMGDVTLAELLVRPLQMNDAAAVAAVKDLLQHHGVITLVSHDRASFERAALYRAATACRRSMPCNSLRHGTSLLAPWCPRTARFRRCLTSSA